MGKRHSDTPATPNASFSSHFIIRILLQRSGFRLEYPDLRGLAFDRRDRDAQKIQVGDELRGSSVVSGKESSDRLVVVRVDLLDDLQVAVERREIEAVEFGVEVHALDAVDGVERLDG